MSIYRKPALRKAAEHHLWTLTKEGTAADLLVRAVREGEHELLLRVGGVFVWRQRIAARDEQALATACAKHRAHMEQTGWQVQQR